MKSKAAIEDLIVKSEGRVDVIWGYISAVIRSGILEGRTPDEMADEIFFIAYNPLETDPKIIQVFESRMREITNEEKETK